MFFEQKILLGAGRALYRSLRLTWHVFKMLYIKRKTGSGSFQSEQDQNKIFLLATAQTKYFFKLAQITKKVSQMLPKYEKVPKFKMLKKLKKCTAQLGHG